MILYLFWMHACPLLDLEDAVFANNIMHIKGPKDKEHCVKSFTLFFTAEGLHFSLPGSPGPSLVWLGLTEKSDKRAENYANN